MIPQASLQNRSFFGGLLVAAMLGIVMLGCTTPDVSDLRTEGIQQFRNHQHIESMATLRRALSEVPSDAQCNYYMGLNYRTLAAGKYRENDHIAAYRKLTASIIYFTQAIKSWPNYMEAIAAKNEALEAQGKYGKALEVASEVTHTTRGYAAEHFIYLGDEYRERADYDNALRAYKVALSSEPNSPQAYAAIGKLYERVGNTELAKDAYRRSYELNKKQPGVAAALARLEMDSGIQSASHEPAP